AQPKPQPAIPSEPPRPQTPPENAAWKAEQEKINQAKANQDLKNMLVKEVNDFQNELYNFMLKTRETQARIQRDIESINSNFNFNSLDTEQLKKECSIDELRSAIKLAYYVQTQLDQAQKALDYKWTTKCDSKRCSNYISFMFHQSIYFRDPLSKLTKNILNMSIEPQNPKLTKGLLTAQKLEALKDVLANHKTIKIKPVNVELRQHFVTMKENYEKIVREKMAQAQTMAATDVITEPVQPQAPNYGTPTNGPKVDRHHNVARLRYGRGDEDEWGRVMFSDELNELI
ncbi:Laminin gamma-1, partial [Operophtera brumata]